MAPIRCPNRSLTVSLCAFASSYPNHAAEREIVRQAAVSGHDPVRPVISGPELTALQDSAAHVTVDESLMVYMLAIVERTRSHESVAMGVSPRGGTSAFVPRQAGAGSQPKAGSSHTPDDV